MKLQQLERSFLVLLLDSQSHTELAFPTAICFCGSVVSCLDSQRANRVMKIKNINQQFIKKNIWR